MITVGSPAPDFTLPDAVTGESITLSNLQGQDVMLIFFRGTWCPFCREQLRILKDNYDKMTACKMHVVGVVCQSPSSVASYLSTNPVPFPVLCDEARTTAKAYGTHYWVSYEGVNLSNPALFILNATGDITFQHVGRNMSDLPVTTVIERFCSLL